MKFTQVAADAFEKLQLNAGVLVTSFDPEDGVLDREKIFGATTGGVNFTASAEYTDFGEDVDNVPNNTKEMKILSSVTATMSGTFLTVDTITAKRLIGAADVLPNGKVVPRADLLQKDFFDVWWVGDYSNANTGDNAGHIAIRLINALSTGGFQIQSGKDAKGTMSFEFTGHYSLSNIAIVPYEIYIKKGAAAEEKEVDTSLSSLAVGVATMVPAFDPATLEYAVTTTNDSDAVTATASDSDADVTVRLDGITVSGRSVAWGTNGKHVLKVVVTIGEHSTTYVVNVTKGE